MRTRRIRWGLWILLIENTRYLIEDRYPVKANSQLNEDAVKEIFDGATTVVDAYVNVKLNLGVFYEITCHFGDTDIDV